MNLWELDTKKVLIAYLMLCIIVILSEVLLTKIFLGKIEIFWSFWICYFGLFFCAHYIIQAFNNIFIQFHINRSVRNLIIPWILFFLVFLFCFFFFSTFYPATEDYTMFFYILILAIIILSIASIGPLIRIIAVGFHRRKYTIFPINRVEFAALKVLSNNKNYAIPFSDLKKQIRGIFNIFIPNIYFDNETAKSSIYHLAGLRYADINNKLVSLTEIGKQNIELWKNRLEKQTDRLENILNSKSILLKSFISLFALSILKIIIGYFNSESLLSEGFENLLDCLAVVLIGIGIRFNKEKLVNIVLICFMSFAGGYILYESINSLIIGPEPISNSFYIIIIALISIFLNIYLRAIKNFVGKKNRNSSLVASAIDSKINISISIGIIFGALLSDFGTSLGLLLGNSEISQWFYYLDPIIAIFVCILIFHEIIEIFTTIISRKEEEMEFESFQMSYEKNFREYVAKWIFIFLYDNLDENYSLGDLNTKFLDSIRKGKEIYSAFAHFGLYLFINNGIDSVIKKLLDDNLLTLSIDNRLNITKKGEFFYETFYSKQLLEDVVDPFDFFFDLGHQINSLKTKKNKLLNQYLLLDKS
jgi:Co/Zn/Cd efflux system component